MAMTRRGLLEYIEELMSRGKTRAERMTIRRRLRATSTEVLEQAFQDSCRKTAELIVFETLKGLRPSQG